MIKLKRMEAVGPQNPRQLLGIALTTGVANRHIIITNKEHTYDAQSWEEASAYDDVSNFAWGDDYTGPRKLRLKKQWA